MPVSSLAHCVPTHETVLSWGQEAAARKAQEAAFVPEEEDEELAPTAQQPASALPLSQGPVQRSNVAPPAVGVQTPAMPTALGDAQQEAAEHSEARQSRAGGRADVRHPRGEEEEEARSSGGQVAGPGPLRPGLNPQMRPRQAGAGSTPQAEGGKEAETGRARLMADLAALQGASNRDGQGRDAGDDAGGQGAEAVWKPPPGQTGDGRTGLNEQLGY